MDGILVKIGRKGRASFARAEIQPDSDALVNGLGLGFGIELQRTPVPPQRWHLTTLSPFFSKPLPSQFLHFCFFLTLGPFSLAMVFSKQ
jgi:hypothetical protein